MTRVLARDLQVGHIYVTNKKYLGTNFEGYNSTYIYLGKCPRYMKGKYIWLYIGSLNGSENRATIYDKIRNHALSIEKTSSNKEVYRLQRYADLNKFKFNINSCELDNRVRQFLKDFVVCA